MSGTGDGEGVGGGPVSTGGVGVVVGSGVEVGFGVRFGAGVVFGVGFGVGGAVGGKNFWEAYHRFDRRGGLVPAERGFEMRFFGLALGITEACEQHGAVEQGALEPAVINLLAGLSQAELQAVADYVSRLPALQAP